MAKQSAFPAQPNQPVNPAAGKRRREHKPRWRGMLADHAPLVRLVVAFVLATASLSTCFTSIEFLSIRLTPSSYVVIAILLPFVTLGALLLGRRAGTLLGLFTGGVMYLHSILMPLDVYEYTFVTFYSSIIAMTACGFLAGSLFARALRNDPPQPKRIIRIVIVCVLVSIVYEFFFISSLFTTLIFQAATDLTFSGSEADLEKIVEASFLRLTIRMGDTFMQAVLDAILAVVLCAIADRVARITVGFEKRIGLRGLFGLGLATVFIVAYMLTTALAFVGITIQKFNQATADINSEMDYIVYQLELAKDRKLLTDQMLGYENLSADNLSDSGKEAYFFIVNQGAIMQGYSEESDGIIIVADGNGTILFSDTPRTIGFTNINQILDGRAGVSAEISMETRTLQRIIFDDIGLSPLSMDDVDDMSEKRSFMAYLLARKDGDNTLYIIRDTGLVYVDRWSTVLSLSISSLVMLGAVFGLTFNLLDRIVVRRLKETNAVLSSVQSGDLDARVEITDSLELAQLSDGINATVTALKGWIAEAESRLDSELALAKSIQASALPSTFPAFPEIGAFDIYASMDPAKEVGGDFYDFFLIGDEAVDSNTPVKLGFIVADVSGKGIPAALFMMESKTQIRSFLMSGIEPGEAIARANHQICEGNDAGMFVTAWVGVLDYETGHVQFVNAGHNPPLVRKDGVWAWERRRSGVPLGVFDGVQYKTLEMDLARGDELLIYSDGVTEGMDVNGELFGEPRLELLAKGSDSLTAQQLVDAVGAAVATHELGAEQSDDITIMALELKK